MNFTNKFEPIDITYYVYRKGDILGQTFAFASLIPIVLLVAEATVVACRREIAGLVLFIGQLTCEVLNRVLKSHFQESRPTGSQICYIYCATLISCHY